MPVILVDHLAKSYRFYRKEPGLRGSLRGLVHREMLETKAVNDLSFMVEQGEVVGFLGPNGAGKTTTLKLLCGLLYPSTGQAMVLGYTPHRREHSYLRQIALVMGQKNMLWWDIPAMETLLMHKEMYRLPEAEFKRTVDELAEILEVAQLLRVQVRKLSLGERMKLELLVALVHRPQILFLDEPTIGLDVVAQQRVRDFLRTLNREQGTTILLTSHYMDDIEALCPRVMVIDHGQLQFDGKLSMLVERIAPYKLLTAVFAEPVEPAVVAAMVAGLDVLPSDDPRRLGLHVPRTEVAEVAGRLLRLGNVVDLSIMEVPVEDIIRQVFSAPAGGKELV
ncbi:MAG: ATP-binding cassette domain-containing protein [Herpetosiphonaceae bacterium]|nr:ATP-binding cassette domain-containing protein [Herpetosiphonaceae bacterium]